MLLKKQVLDGIAEGRITVAFRRWKRPTVKTGGSLRTTVGLLAIEFVEVVDEERITKQDAKRAGFVDNILGRDGVEQIVNFPRVPKMLHCHLPEGNEVGFTTVRPSPPGPAFTVFMIWPQHDGDGRTIVAVELLQKTGNHVERF